MVPASLLDRVARERNKETINKTALKILFNPEVYSEHLSLDDYDAWKDVVYVMEGLCKAVENVELKLGKEYTGRRLERGSDCLGLLAV